MDLLERELNPNVVSFGDEDQLAASEKGTTQLQIEELSQKLNEKFSKMTGLISSFPFLIWSENHQSSILGDTHFF